MNKNGFTLVETLAVLVLLSILLMIAVPSISALMEINKKNTFVTDSKRFLAKVENEVERNVEIDYPKSNEILYFQLKYFNQNDFKKSPYGTSYDEEYSFVTLKATYSDDNKEPSGLEYKVYLIACEGDNNCYGTINGLQDDSLNKNNISKGKKKEIDSIIKSVYEKQEIRKYGNEE